mmetsp:Transcript_32357/g.58767  ORF Transcript_32357/g.58767 Transcript_32357/m.58767 type:complete len:205 (+) Transcript_32357:39-653(+)
MGDTVSTAPCELHEAPPQVQRPSGPDRPEAEKVWLALTPLTPRAANIVGLPTAYHSSVAVAGVEYSFSDSTGVVCTAVKNKSILKKQADLLLESHKKVQGPSILLPMGGTRLSGPEMAKVLMRHFQQDTYDLLLKNCNHFSDCALFFLLGRRLPAEFCQAEQMAPGGLVGTLSLGTYSQNPNALHFSLASTLESLAAERKRRKC